MCYLGGNTQGYFDRYIDDVRIWHEALSATDVEAVYASSDALYKATKVVEYGYDAFDRRVVKEIDANGDGAMTDAGDKAHQYIYDGQDIVLAFDKAAALANRYLHGPAVDQILSDEQYTGGASPANSAGTTYWPLADNQGSVRQLVTSDGEEAKRINYDSFGQMTVVSGSAVDHIFAYTGREHDAESHLQYNRARYYDAALGRWISEDPIGFAAGDANLARYVGNGPTNATDPSGLEEFGGFGLNGHLPDVSPPHITDGFGDMGIPAPGETPVNDNTFFDVHLPPEPPKDDPPSRPVDMPIIAPGMPFGEGKPAFELLPGDLAGKEAAQGWDKNLGMWFRWHRGRTEHWHEDYGCWRVFDTSDMIIPAEPPAWEIGLEGFLWLIGMGWAVKARKGGAVVGAVDDGAKLVDDGARLADDAAKAADDAAKDAAQKLYDRPSGYRKGTRDKVWDDAKATSPDGVVRDPLTGKEMKLDDPWDMGHKPGHEFRKHQQSAQDRGITRKQFLDEHNNADQYRPELPSSNRSHRGEDLTDSYFGP